MDIKQLETVLAVAELKSFSEAAFSLSLSQSSVSKHVSSIEQEFGIQIFERSNRVLKLLPLGKEFVLYAQQTVEEYKNFRNILNEQLALPYPRNLTLSIPAALRLDDIIGQVDSFKLKFPKTSISLTDDESQSVVLNLIIRGKLDAAFVIDFRNIEKISSELYLDSDNRLQLYPIYCTRYYITVNKAHPISKRDFIDMEDLKFQDIYARIFLQNMRYVFEDACHDCGISPRLITVLSTNSVINSQDLKHNGILLRAIGPIPEDNILKNIPLSKLYSMMSLICLKDNISSALADFIRHLGLKPLN